MIVITHFESFFFVVVVVVSNKADKTSLWRTAHPSSITLDKTTVFIRRKDQKLFIVHSVITRKLDYYTFFLMCAVATPFI